MPDLDLPYEYSRNTQDGGLVYRIALAAATVALGVAAYLGRVPIWTAFIPSIIFAIRVFFYTLIRNAVHEATRMADVDSRLDDTVLSQIDAQKRTGLTPGFLNEKLIGASE